MSDPKDQYEDINSNDSVEEEEKDHIDLTKPKDHDFELYTRLGVEKNATSSQIKKAYRLASLRVHPDKNPDDPEADAKFQKVNEAYVILSDENKRKRYDLTGEIDDDGLDDLVNKCRFFYKEFCEEDIDTFATSYRDSKDEEEDLVNYYNQHNGDLTKLLSWIPLSQNHDVVRFIEIFDRLIEEKVIKATEEYHETRENIELLKEEVKEAEEQKSEKKRDKKSRKKKKTAEPSLDDLRSQILARKQKSSNDFLSNLASKYCDPDDPMGDMPSEEEFQRVQKKIKKTTKPKTSTKAKGKPKTKKIKASRK
ncbi:unnamed protein product [Moneuplotes crassus]|uniref:J domain-containing protein n=1 Tax=Euplotes crassus TaxID=5936 RepID=A0AAD2D0P5_EUPCR|nr:unnamed protein product [Moneuplotes crassus]